MTNLSTPPDLRASSDLYSRTTWDAVVGLTGPTNPARTGRGFALWADTRSVLSTMQRGADAIDARIMLFDKIGHQTDTETMLKALWQVAVGIRRLGELTEDTERDRRAAAKDRAECQLILAALQEMSDKLASQLKRIAARTGAGLVDGLDGGLSWDTDQLTLLEGDDRPTVSDFDRLKLGGDA